MRQLRSLLFWLHLIAGLSAGIVIVIMSATGVALMYQRQIQSWADRGSWRPRADAVPKLTVEQLYAVLRRDVPDAVAATVTLRAGDGELATVAMTGARTGNVLVDPYTGAIVAAGPNSARVRAVFASMTSWHRYLAATGDARPWGRAVTGISNLAFLFIVSSGVYLWWPRSLRWKSLRSIVWFRRGLPGKARDFNWHNVLGFWSAVPLAVVVASGVVISFPWASNLVYRTAGETPPAPAGRGAPPAQRPGPGGGQGRQGGDGARDGALPLRERHVANLDAIVAAAASTQPDWRSITVPLPTEMEAPVTVTIDTGDGGQPQRRGTITFDRVSVSISRREMFADQSTGRRWRSLLRFAHTGEVLGLTGQTIAGFVSAASLILAYTGVALAWRRFSAWLGRRAKRAGAAPAEARVDLLESPTGGNVAIR